MPSVALRTSVMIAVSAALRGEMAMQTAANRRSRRNVPASPGNGCRLGVSSFKKRPDRSLAHVQLPSARSRTFTALSFVRSVRLQADLLTVRLKPTAKAGHYYKPKAL